MKNKIKIYLLFLLSQSVVIVVFVIFLNQMLEWIMIICFGYVIWEIKLCVLILFLLYYIDYKTENLRKKGW